MSHPLLGNMARLTLWQIQSRLAEFPPDRWDAVAIAREESRRRTPEGKPDDRREVYAELAKYVAPIRVAAALLSDDAA